MILGACILELSDALRHSQLTSAFGCLIKWHSKPKNHEAKLRLNDCAATLPLEITVAVLFLVWKLVGRASCISNEITSIRFKMPLTSLGKTNRKAVFTHRRHMQRWTFKIVLDPNDIFAASEAFFACFINNIHWAHGWYHAELHKDLAGWFFQPRFASLQPWYSQHLG